VRVPTTLSQPRPPPPPTRTLRPAARAFLRARDRRASATSGTWRPWPPGGRYTWLPPLAMGAISVPVSAPCSRQRPAGLVVRGRARGGPGRSWRWTARPSPSWRTPGRWPPPPRDPGVLRVGSRRRGAAAARSVITGRVQQYVTERRPRGTLTNCSPKPQNPNKFINMVILHKSLIKVTFLNLKALPLLLKGQF
jgi:hypothetical protein